MRFLNVLRQFAVFGTFITALTACGDADQKALEAEDRLKDRAMTQLLDMGFTGVTVEQVSRVHEEVWMTASSRDKRCVFQILRVKLGVLYLIRQDPEEKDGAIRLNSDTNDDGMYDSVFGGIPFNSLKSLEGLPEAKGCDMTPVDHLSPSLNAPPSTTSSSLMLPN